MTVDAVNNLKAKFIKDFDEFRQKLQKGYSPNYKMLLQEIIVIEHADCFDDNIYQYLMSL